MRRARGSGGTKSSGSFSSRLPASLAANAVSVALEAVRADGAPWIDLTETNPTVVGLPYPPALLDSLGDPGGLRYDPSPLGLPSARRAVAADYARRGRDVSLDRVAVTASTSEAYSALFKLLCNPGDTVLVPQPGYPLFDLLAGLDGVVVSPYRLAYHGHWTIDRVTLENAVDARTRAVLVVSPNNPTGSILTSGDKAWLTALGRARGFAVIVDEVFADYPLAPGPDAARGVDSEEVLTFSLGGLSKTIGLPQAKLGWIAAGGPDPQVRDAMARLELICDTYLSCSTIVQRAAAELLAEGRTVRHAIVARIAQNLRVLRACVGRGGSVSLLEPEAGWSAVLRVPAIESEEALILRLLHEERVLVHPGYFFDFAHEAFIVVSLLPDPAVFADAAARVVRAIGRGPRS